MGAGASSESSSAQGKGPARPASAQAGANGARKRLLVSGNNNRAMTPNASSRAVAANGKSAADTKRGGAAGTSHGRRADNGGRSGTDRTRAATKHRLKLQQEEDLKVLTRSADPLSLDVLEKIEASDRLPDDQPAQKLQLLQQCYPMLEKVAAEDFDQLAMTIYQKEGEIYQQQGATEPAKETYTRAITLAERRVARGDKDMYTVLKRYVLAMIGVARIWYEEERETKGFEFVDSKHPRVAALEANADNKSDASSSLSSLESTFSSVGSVFSLNQAILKSMAPRPPRRRTGPTIGTIKVKAPRQIPGSQLATREDEFVLHSKMTRELVASPCELLLLRCCEVVEIGLHSQSELLIPPLIELAQLYEDLALYGRALLVVRRCLGILCNVYDYDHPWVIELRGLADYLDALRQEQLRNEAATKIQSVWRMYRAMNDLERALGRPVHRHYWIPKKYRPTPDIDFLGDLADAIPADNDGEGALPGEESGTGTPADRALPAPHTPVAQQYPTEEEDPARSAPRAGDTPNLAPVLYDPVRSVGDVATFTTMVPNAKVIGTTQDTQTDTHVQPTDKGDVLTVRTTTVTKTITEKLPGSDDDDDEENPEELPEEPCDVPIPHCPRCDTELPIPHCARCSRELPPPPLPEDLEEVAAGGRARCPYCRVHRAEATRHCPRCDATLPTSRRWPNSGIPPDPREEPIEWCERCHEPVPLDTCRACQRELPPPPYAGEEDYQLDPHGAPRCPFCRDVQPPMQCPECDAEPEPEPLVAHEQEEPHEVPQEVPVPHCPRCERELDEPQCPNCSRAVPPPPPADEDPRESLSRCPFCRVHQPVHRCGTCHRALPLVRPDAAPRDAEEAARTLATCPYCTSDLHTPTCPACHREQPPPPYAGEEGYAADPSKPPRCPYCRDVQPPMQCPECDAEPEASSCASAKQPEVQPGRERELPTPVAEALPVERGLSLSPTPPVAEPQVEAAAEVPASTPLPHCPRCLRALAPPHCPGCTLELPPPPPPGEETRESLSRCPFCRVHQPEHRCATCYRTLPLVRPDAAPEDERQARRQLTLCPYCGLEERPAHCAACGHPQPPAPYAGEEDYASDPSKPPRCPYCLTAQPPLRCPHCDVPAPAEEVEAEDDGAEDEDEDAEDEEEVLCPKCGQRELEFPPDCPFCRHALPAEIVPTEPFTEANPTADPAPLCPFCAEVLPLACPLCDAVLPATAGATPVEQEVAVTRAPPPAQPAQPVSTHRAPATSRAAQTSPPPPVALSSHAVQTATAPPVVGQDAATMTVPVPPPAPPARRDAQTATEAQPSPPPQESPSSSSVECDEDEHFDVPELAREGSPASSLAEAADDNSSAYTVISSHSSVRYEQCPGAAAPQPVPAAVPMPGMYPGAYPGMGSHYYYVYYPVGGAMPMMMGAPPVAPSMPPPPPQPPHAPTGHSRHHRYRRSSRSSRRGSRSIGDAGTAGVNTSNSITLSELRAPCPSCRRSLPPLRCPECARRQPEPAAGFLYDPANPPRCRSCGADQPVAHCPYCFIELARVRSSATAASTPTASAAQSRRPVPPSQPRRSSTSARQGTEAHRHSVEVHSPVHAPPPLPPMRSEAAVTRTTGTTTTTATMTGAAAAQSASAITTATPVRGQPAPQYAVTKDANGNTVYQETTDTPGGYRIVREYTIERTRIDRTTVSDDGDEEEEEEYEEGEEQEEEGDHDDEEDITDPEEDEEVMAMLAELRAQEEADPVLIPSPARTGASTSQLPSISIQHVGMTPSRVPHYNGSSLSFNAVSNHDLGLDEAITTTTRDVQRIPNGKRTVVQSITRRRSQMEQPSAVLDVNPPNAPLLQNFPNLLSGGVGGISLPTLSHRSSASGSLQKPHPTNVTQADTDNVVFRDEL